MKYAKELMWIHDYALLYALKIVTGWSRWAPVALHVRQFAELIETTPDGRRIYRDSEGNLWDCPNCARRRPSTPGADGGGFGNLRVLSKQRLKDLGIDAEAFKAAVLDYPATYNIAVNTDGDVYLVPVQRGNKPPVETGYSLDEVKRDFPLTQDS